MLTPMDQPSKQKGNKGRNQDLKTSGEDSVSPHAVEGSQEEANEFKQESGNSGANIILNEFLKSPLSVHDQVNPSKQILTFNGSNFFLWRAAINRTFHHISERFDKEDTFFSNFKNLTDDESKALEVLMRNIIEKQLLDIVDSSKVQGPEALYELLMKKCQPFGRKHKLEVVELLMRYTKQKTPPTPQLIASWHELNFRFKELDVSVEELLGLLLQANSPAPSGMSQGSFDLFINKRIKDQEGRSLDVVSSLVETTSYNPPGSNAQSNRNGYNY